MTTESQVQELIGSDVIGSDGERIGAIGQVYLDDSTGRPEWVTVRTGMFGKRESFVPLAQARRAGNELHVPYTKNKVKDAPNVEADERLSEQEEANLYRHYGISQAQVPTQPGMPGTGTTSRETAGAGAGGPGRHAAPGGPDQRSRGQAPTGRVQDEAAMTAAEERLRVGKERQEAGHVRLRKWVETEEADRKVQLTHQEAVVERHRIEDGRPDQTRDLGEDEAEITLYEERPVVSTEQVPVERVSVRRKDVPTEETVHGKVRREHIDVDRDPEPGRTQRGAPDPGSDRPDYGRPGQ
ncbi:DUF2382 domain-containing protein [Bailinhaonella thermotolerans]|nr:PRC and DUF2382 domain-containing protein [Bailinhaonella thermotolerans]